MPGLAIPTTLLRYQWPILPKMAGPNDFKIMKVLITRSLHVSGNKACGVSHTMNGTLHQKRNGGLGRLFH
jgi:hypothetical protein